MKLDNLMKAAVPLRMLGIVVTQNGKEIGRELTEGACRRNIYSASKSFTSAAVGIAIKEGLLDLNEKITDAFADDLPETVSDNLGKATVRDLLTMCLGQGKGFLMGEDRPYYTDENWVRLALEQPFIYEPGTKFVYNNVGPYLAGSLYRDVQERILSTISIQGCSSLWASSFPHGKPILTETHSVQEGFSLHWMNCISSESCILIWDVLREDRSYLKDG